MHRKKHIKSECAFIGFKNNRFNHRCKECNKTSSKSVNDLSEKFTRMHKFCNDDLNKFVLLLRKGVYPYEYMNSWERFNETSLPQLELLTDYQMLLMIEEGLRGGMCQSTHRYAKANNKYMKNYDKNIETSYLKYLDANNLSGWTMSQKLPINGFMC